MQMVIPLTKIDVEKRLIYGRAAHEIPDKTGEIMDYESARPVFEAWSQQAMESSGGKSKGNLRVMHRDVAAGKVVDMTFDDRNRAVDVAVKVVDDNEWQKCIEGVYTGFSIGGSYGRRWKDGEHTRYTPKISEISLVDNPCIPTARFYEMVKVDGSVEKREFQSVMTDEDGGDLPAPTMSDRDKSLLDLDQKNGEVKAPGYTWANSTELCATCANAENGYCTLYHFAYEPTAVCESYVRATMGKDDSPQIDEEKFDLVMQQFGSGKLKDGNGDKVSDRKEALSIAYSEARKMALQKGDDYEMFADVLKSWTPKGRKVEKRDRLPNAVPPTPAPGPTQEAVVVMFSDLIGAPTRKKKSREKEQADAKAKVVPDRDTKTVNVGPMSKVVMFDDLAKAEEVKPHSQKYNTKDGTKTVHKDGYIRGGPAGAEVPKRLQNPKNKEAGLKPGEGTTEETAKKDGTKKVEIKDKNKKVISRAEGKNASVADAGKQAGLSPGSGKPGFVEGKVTEGPSSSQKPGFIEGGKVVEDGSAKKPRKKTAGEKFAGDRAKNARRSAKAGTKEAKQAARTLGSTVGSVIDDAVKALSAAPAQILDTASKLISEGSVAVKSEARDIARGAMESWKSLPAKGKAGAVLTSVAILGDIMDVTSLFGGAVELVRDKESGSSQIKVGGKNIGTVDRQGADFASFGTENDTLRFREARSPSVGVAPQNGQQNRGGGFDSIYNQPNKPAGTTYQTPPPFNPQQRAKQADQPLTQDQVTRRNDSVERFVTDISNMKRMSDANSDGERAKVLNDLSFKTGGVLEESDSAKWSPGQTKNVIGEIMNAAGVRKDPYPKDGVDRAFAEDVLTLTNHNKIGDTAFLDSNIKFNSEEGHFEAEESVNRRTLANYSIAAAQRKGLIDDGVADKLRLAVKDVSNKINARITDRDGDGRHNEVEEKTTERDLERQARQLAGGSKPVDMDEVARIKASLNDRTRNGSGQRTKMVVDPLDVPSDIEDEINAANEAMRRNYTRPVSFDALTKGMFSKKKDLRKAIEVESYTRRDDGKTIEVKSHTRGNGPSQSAPGSVKDPVKRAVLDPNLDPEHVAETFGSWGGGAAGSAAVVSTLSNLPGGRKLGLAARFALSSIGDVSGSVAGSAAGGSVGRAVSDATGVKDSRKKRGAPGKAEQTLSMVGGFLGSTVAGVGGAALGTSLGPGGSIAGFVGGEALGGTVGEEAGATLGRFLDSNYKAEMNDLYDDYIKGSILGGII